MVKKNEMNGAGYSAEQLAADQARAAAQQNTPPPADPSDAPQVEQGTQAQPEDAVAGYTPVEEATPEELLSFDPPETLADAVRIDVERQRIEARKALLEHAAAEAVRQERSYLRSIGGEEMVGTVRNFLLDCARDIQTQDRRPWNERPQHDQNRTARAAEEAARSIVRTVVAAVGANSFPAVEGLLKQITVKGGFKAVIEVGKTEDQAMDLVAHEGKAVMIVLADAREYDSHVPVQITPDEPTLPFAGGDSVESEAEGGEDVGNQVDSDAEGEEGVGTREEAEAAA